MRLLPIFFLALFSSSVLWAQSQPVWTPAATPTPASTPRSEAAADPATPEKKIAGNAAGPQDAQPAVWPSLAHSDLLSTLANRQDQSVTLTIDEAAGVEMTREWRERAKEFESQNMTDGAVQFSWPSEIPSIVVHARGLVHVPWRASKTGAAG